MNPKDHQSVGRWLSWALRHAPSEARLELDASGGASVERVLSALEAHGIPANRLLLGLGIAIVNGICRIPPRLAAGPIDGLPAVSYWIIWRPEGAGRAAIRTIAEAVIDSTR